MFEKRSADKLADEVRHVVETWPAHDNGVRIDGLSYAAQEIMKIIYPLISRIKIAEERYLRAEDALGYRPAQD